jgi:CelD/BcsL family acetyltransferase involved in cellulose biosynthesis
MLQALSSSFRQTVKRKIRKAEKTASMEMRIVTDASCIDDIMTISLESWQHDNGTSMASTPQIRDFYTQVIQGAATDGSLQVGLMYIDGEPAAFDFNLICRSVMHNFKLGFRRQYAQLSPGIVLKSYILQNIYANQSECPIAELDFMGASEPYKLSWAASVRSHSRLLIFADRIDMRCAHWLTFQLKPFVHKSMPWLISLSRQVKNIGRKQSS